jgi:hypothetical protein
MPAPAAVGYFNLLGRPMSMRILDTAHLVILPGAELIVIRHDPASLQSCNETCYAGIWTYIPLCRVIGAELEDRADGQALASRLPGGERFEVLFTPEYLPQVLILRQVSDQHIIR